MTRRPFLLTAVLLCAVIGCRDHRQPQQASSATPPSQSDEPTGASFTDAELAQFKALRPIDTHTHIYQSAPQMLAMLDRLNLHILDILVTETPDQKALDTERSDAWAFVAASNGHASLCDTFNPFVYNEPGFARKVSADLNNGFDRGAIAVKIWKNIGEQVKDSKGRYLLPDDPVFEPIYQDIAAHHKTLIAHVADPDSIWEAPNPQSPDYSYYMEHPEWYMYNKPGIPSKATILLARDRLLEKNPKLRVVGAHLGSMERNLDQIGQHLDRYPNFAVDLAARMPYFVMQPRDTMIAFITKYQDRIIYATDDELPANADAAKEVPHLERGYAVDWRYLATTDNIEYRGKQVQGLGLPLPILRKLYHDNAVQWFPGIDAGQQQ
ncbi:amidohydrolase family protein [Paracidobacterium acidisoli]|uniref:amidohydrolase family protein n=1 Tax=Paracidobacterium acidisoli TaxID=2303751 RepID=UPI0026B47B4F